MEVIRSIEPIRAKVWFELDSGERQWLGRQAALESGWEQGTEISREDFRRYILLHQYPHALNLAVAMLARRACSRGEIERRLNTARYMDETVEMVLYKLDKEGFLNDRDFAVQWVRSRISRKLGASRIRMELRQKGVDEEDIRSALENVDEQEQLTQAVSLAEKGFARARPDEDQRNVRRRVMSSLIRRGYSWDTARQACSLARGEEDDGL